MGLGVEVAGTAEGPLGAPCPLCWEATQIPGEATAGLQLITKGADTSQSLIRIVSNVLTVAGLKI